MLVENSTRHSLSYPHKWGILESKESYVRLVPHNVAKELSSVMLVKVW
jgi:hypothetical protein